MMLHISDLIETKGISRATLYDGFGYKDALFKLVLEHNKNFGVLAYKIHVLFLLSEVKWEGMFFGKHTCKVIFKINPIFFLMRYCCLFYISDYVCLECCERIRKG